MVYYGYSIILFLLIKVFTIYNYYIYNNEQYHIMTNSNSDEREFEEGASRNPKGPQE